MANIYNTPDGYTPGVYIQEFDAYPNSVVPASSSIPAFVGYTEKAKKGTKDLTNIPTQVTSLSDYVENFGGKPDIKFNIQADADSTYTLKMDPKTRFNMFAAIRFFYANGGRTCYIVSAGGYDPAKGVEALPLNDEKKTLGLPTLLKEQEPSLLVIPDAVLLEAEACYTLQKAMITHCKTMQNRFAILDVHDGYKAPGGDVKVIKNFRAGINLGGENMQWAAAYYPWLNTTLFQDSEIDFTAINNLKELVNLLKAENAASKLSQSQKDAIDETLDTIETTGKSNDDEKINTLSNTLKTVSPLYQKILNDLRKEINLMPPSSGMAGVYSLVDNDYGVQKAPANVSMTNVIDPTVNISNEEQDDLNVPLDGLAVNAIRSFVGQGPLVWGARTLDGNSQDWKYINVRRSMIMLEQSIKNAAEAYVFEPNDANTWADVKSMIVIFLATQWRNGVLAGAGQDDAFIVDVGLGTTMTPADILDGIMNVTVKVALLRPAEFLVITFQQQMKKG